MYVPNFCCDLLIFALLTGFSSNEISRWLWVEGDLDEAEGESKMSKNEFQVPRAVCVVRELFPLGESSSGLLIVGPSRSPILMTLRPSFVRLDQSNKYEMRSLKNLSLCEAPDCR